MPDTPHIKRFEEYSHVLIDNRSSTRGFEAGLFKATQDMFNDLAKHIERLERRIEHLESFTFKLPPGVSIHHLHTDTPPEMTAHPDPAPTEER